LLADLQIPFEHPKALEFCLYLKRHYKLSDDNIYCVGDEVDQYWAGLYPKDINGDLTARQEIEITREKIRMWISAFPKVKVCTSNHGSRWARKALQSEIPSIMMRRYQEVLGFPPGWVWSRNWIIPGKQPILVEHGDAWGGQYPHVAAALHNGISTVMGHHHSLCGIERIRSSRLDIWGAVIGCLIDFDKYAFNYAREAKKKPQIGTMVICSGIPIWIPLAP
jgi:hypothetical protein